MLSDMLFWTSLYDAWFSGQAITQCFGLGQITVRVIQITNPEGKSRTRLS